MTNGLLWKMAIEIVRCPLKMVIKTIGLRFARGYDYSGFGNRTVNDGSLDWEKWRSLRRCQVAWDVNHSKTMMFFDW